MYADWKLDHLLRAIFLNRNTSVGRRRRTAIRYQTNPLLSYQQTQKDFLCPGTEPCKQSIADKSASNKMYLQEHLKSRLEP
jgi:hypothetical protein